MSDGTAISDADDDFLNLAAGQVLTSDEETDEDRPKKLKSSRPAKVGSTTSQSRQRPHGDSEEEGEAEEGPASPASLESAPMDESDSDDNAPSRSPIPQSSASALEEGDEVLRYPVDGIFESEHEKAKIMGMKMLDREQIIAERRAAVEKLHQHKMLRQLVNKRENDEKKLKKRKVSDVEEEDAVNKATRLRAKPAASGVPSAYDELKKARTAKNDRMRMREEERQKTGAQDDRRPSTGHSSPRDRSRGDSRHRRMSRSRSPRHNILSEPALLRDIEHVRIGRFNFGQICFHPGFEDVMNGCFCRLAMGPDKTGHPTYRMAVIKSITTGKPYALQLRNTQLVTDQYVLLQHGKSTREWPFIMVSNDKFTEAEFSEYKQRCAEDGVPLPTRGILINKVDQIDALIKYQFSPKELQEKLDRQNSLKKRFIPTIDKEQVQLELEHALAVGNELLAKELREKLEQAEVPRLAFHTQLQTPRAAKSEQQERLAQLNQRNRLANIEDVRAAQVREKQRQRAREKAMERGEEAQVDKSRRLKTRDRFMHDSKQLSGMAAGGVNGTLLSGDSRAGFRRTNGAGAQLHKDDIAFVHAVESAKVKRYDAAKKAGLNFFVKPVTADDVIAEMDWGIDDIEL